MPASLIERLEKAAKAVSVWNYHRAYGDEYDLEAADLRDLLEAAVAELKNATGQS